MPSTQRTESQDRGIKHQPSMEKVPMWDSSDPGRAPPPLPLNPGRDMSPTKPNISANVAAAAQALVERARENMNGHYMVNPVPDKSSPEKSPIKTPQHRRLQSLQTGREAWSSPGPATPPERPASAFSLRESRSISPDRTPTRDGSPTPVSSRRGSVMHGVARSPTSATVLALRDMPVPDDIPALADVTNRSTPPAKKEAPLHSTETIQAQISNLTTIANSLQKEMVALSRRSKDNATDLNHLKEATKTRDEDIRKGLREVITGMKSPESFLRPSSRTDHSRASSSMGIASQYLDSRHSSTPPFVKSISLPKIPSANGMDFESERTASPTPFGGDGTAGIVMLEKIIREMVTKEGQEHLLDTLSQLLEKSSQTNAGTAKKVEELVELIKERPENKALVRHTGAGRRFSFEDAASEVDSDLEAPQSRALAKGRTDNQQRGQNTNTAPHNGQAMEELTKIVQKVRDSVMHTGGMTSEVKTLVRDLRAQVSAVGQDLGKRIHEATKERAQNSSGSSRNEQEELVAIVQDELADLKQQMEKLVSLRRRDSNASSLSRNTVDSSEINAVVRHVLAEQGVDNVRTPQENSLALSEEAIFNAIHEACKELQVDVQHDGLERDEILQCLREGLESYQSAREPPQSAGATKEVVMKAVQDGLRDFKAPSVGQAEIKEIKEELFASVKDCFESYRAEAPRTKTWESSDVSRDDIINAVADALDTFKKEGAREIEISREDLFYAVKAGLDETGLSSYGDDVLKSLHDIVEGMRVEFKQYSAANGRDTEQVLDALKDGLETLRTEIESYVDRAQDVTGRDEIISTLKENLGSVRDTLDDFMSQQRNNNTTAEDNQRMADFIRQEFEQLHGTLAERSQDNNDHSHSAERILAAMAAGFAGLEAHKANKGVEDLPEDMLDAMKTEFDQLREAVLHGTASQKDDMVDALQSSLAGLQAQMSGQHGYHDSQEIVRNMRDEFESLKESLASTVTQPSSAGFDSAEILESIQHSLEAIRVQFVSDQSEANNEAIGLIKQELEVLRESLGASMVPTGSQVSNEEVLAAVQEGLDRIHNSTSARNLDGDSGASLEAVRTELEQLRESISNMVVPAGGSRATDERSEEILDAVRIGIEDLKEHMDNSSKQVSFPETGGIDTINEGLESIKREIAGLADRPVDMTMMHEILDTVKHGISGLSADIERLKSDNEVVLADADRSGGAAGGSMGREDLQRFEVLLTQLQIKVEAMDENVQNVAASSSHQSDATATKTDLMSIQTTLYDLQANVMNLSTKEESMSSGLNKEDGDEIKALIYETKTQIEERILPELDATKRKEALEDIESVARMTHIAVENLATKVGEPATKDDVAAIAHLLDTTSTSLNELKDSIATGDEKITRLDIDAVTVACEDVKTALMSLPAAENAPTKTDFEDLTILLTDLKGSYDSLRDRYEGDIHVTAKAFDDRKEEATDILLQLDGLKTLVEESKDELKSRMRKGNDDVRALDEILQGIEDKLDAAPNAVSDVQDLMKSVTEGFEKAQSVLEELKVNTDANSSTLHTQAEDSRSQIISELSKKFDERYDELLACQEVVKDASDKAGESLKERAEAQEELLRASREMAEDLKLTIDTLGTSVTSITPALNEATEKISDDSRTVFNKIDEIHSRLDGGQNDLKVEQEQTRNEVLQVLTVSNALQELLSGFQPTALTSLDAILNLVQQHFDHSRNIGEKAEENHNRTWESMKTVSEFLPRLEAPTSSHEQSSDVDSQSRSAIDESRIHDKLDELVGLATDLHDSKPQLDQLEGLHKQMMASTAEISAFTAFQTKLLSAQQENKEVEAREATAELERAQRESNDLYAQIVELKESKQSLASELDTLKAENQAMMTQKMRLTGEVSSLETALQIRREELHMMDQRADALERRIIDRVMDHSRALLITKAPKSQVNMSLKRVTSSTSNSTNATTVPGHSSTASAVDMALRSKGGRTRTSTKPAELTARRILSLSQINNNVATGIKSLSTTPRSPVGGLSNIKRSQSTRNPAVRKRESWAPGQGSLALYDKENAAEMAEEDEEESFTEKKIRDDTLDDDFEVARPGTATRSTSNSNSEWTYATGSESYMTESASRASIGSVVRSTMGTVSSLHEEEEEEEENEDAGHAHEEGLEGSDQPEGENQQHVNDDEYDEQQQLQEQMRKDLVLRTDGYDSGLGSDLPTAAAMSTMSGDHGGSFQSLNKM